MNNLTPVPQFSGYPLKPFPLEKDMRALLLPLTSGESKPFPPKANAGHLSDVQENWDESWFANYE